MEDCWSGFDETEDDFQQTTDDWSKSEKCFKCSQEITDRFLVKLGSDSSHESCTECAICAESVLNKGSSATVYYRQVVCADCRTGLRQNMTVENCVLFISRFIRQKVRCFICQQSIPWQPYLLIHPAAEFSTSFSEISSSNFKTSSMYAVHKKCAVCYTCKKVTVGGIQKCFVQNGDGKRFYCDHCDPSSSEIDSLDETSEAVAQCDNQHSDDVTSDSKYSKSDNDNEQQLSGCSVKRPRTIISQNQYKNLVQRFYQNPKPSKADRDVMANELGLTARTVQKREFENSDNPYFQADAMYQMPPEWEETYYNAPYNYDCGVSYDYYQ